MSGIAAVIPKYQFASATGAPLVGGTLDVYIAGSTTRTPTWQDAARQTLNQNPVPLDSRGECVLYLNPTIVYKFVLKNSAGSTQWTQDNVSARIETSKSLSAFSDTLGNGGDDTDALNLASAWLREQISTAGGNHAVKLILPYGYSLITEGGWDLTDIRGGTGDGIWCIENEGATITGHCTGKPVVDLMRSLGGKLSGLHIVGDSTDRPRMGIQLARGTTGESADFFSLEDCRVEGYHTIAPFYNMSSERFAASHCVFRNEYAGAECFAAVIDGRNKYTAVSDYYTSTIAVETAQSCLSHLFEQCTFYNNGSGPAIFMTRASRVEMQRCYGLSVDSVGVRIGMDTNGARDLIFDLHLETTGTLTSAFEFTSEGGSTAGEVRGFEWKENASNATNSILKTTLNSMRISHRNIQIGSYNIAPTSFYDGVFIDHGDIDSPVQPTFGTAETVTGNLHVADYSIATFRFPKGAQTVTDKESGDKMHKGAHRHVGTTAESFLGDALATKQEVKFEGGKLFLGGPTGDHTVIEIGDTATETPEFWFDVVNSGATLRLRRDVATVATDVMVFNPSNEGTMRVPRLAADPTGTAGGDMYFNTVSLKFRGFNGSTWADL